jgi:hypothetical protein
MSDNTNTNTNTNVIEDMRRRVNTYSSINQNSNFQDNIIEDNTKLMEDMIKKYDENTKNKAAIGVEYYETAERVVDLKNDINKRSSYLRELEFKEGALKAQTEKNIYDNNKYTDMKDVYKIIFGIHGLILIIMLLGLFRVVNSLVIVIIIFILYIIICGLILYKHKYDKDRNKFKYKEFDVKFEPKKVCSFNPVETVKKDENEEKVEDKEQLKQFTK